MTPVTVEFALGAAQERREGEDVILSGPVFECGDYEDKGFSLTPEEMYRTIGRFFGPVPMDLEHKPSEFNGVDLTGVFGLTRRIWAKPEDEWLYGEIAKPAWLDEIMPERRVSATFDRETKDLIGVAWTGSPRVQGAEVFAAFSAVPSVAERILTFAGTRHSTPEGQSVMQNIHDMAARAGAVCDRTNAAKMASQHEATTIQRIHDMAATHGASCSSGDRPSWFSTGDKPMTAWEKFLGLLESAGLKKADFADIDPAEFAAPAQMSEADRAEMARLKQETASLRAQNIQASAAAFADRAIAESRAYPAEREILITEFTARAEDDAATPRQVSFSARKPDGTAEQRQGTRAEAFAASVLGRPPHGLTSEQIQAAAFNVVGVSPSASAEEQAKLEAEVEKTLKATSVGQAILASKNGQKK